MSKPNAFHITHNTDSVDIDQKMSEYLIRLHALSVRLKLDGAWYFATIIDRMLLEHKNK